MEDRRPRRLTLDLEPDTEPIEGRIREGSGPSREFTGWLGLAAALGTVLGARAAAEPRPPGSSARTTGRQSGR